MSRDRGLRLQNALAQYLRQWWPSAESAGSGRPGSDVLGTPGIVWECKTAREFRPLEWMRQARQHAMRPDGVATYDLPVVVYWPVGVGARSAAETLAILPLGRLVRLLAASEFEEA